MITMLYKIYVLSEIMLTHSTFTFLYSDYSIVSVTVTLALHVNEYRNSMMK